jgi:hypothetical protein
MRQKEKKKSSKAGNEDLDNSGDEPTTTATKIVPIENCAASEEQVKPFAKQMSESVEDEKLTEIRDDTCEGTEDSENNLKHAKETYVFKSDEPRFLDFPERFEDWSEDQKKDAYDNNFKLYLEKDLQRINLFGSLPE